jgi:hypothetical protein
MSPIRAKEIQLAHLVRADRAVDDEGSVCRAAIELALAHLAQDATEAFTDRLVADAHVSEECLDRPYERNRPAIELLRNALETYED